MKNHPYRYIIYLPLTLVLIGGFLLRVHNIDFGLPHYFHNDEPNKLKEIEKYLKDIKGPLPHIRLSPTGGVSLDNAGEFIRCGACCIAVGGNLVSKKALAAKDWATITDTAKKFIEEVKKARE